jgi:hypothetical protein
MITTAKRKIIVLLIYFEEAFQALDLLRALGSGRYAPANPVKQIGSGNGASGRHVANHVNAWGRRSVGAGCGIKRRCAATTEHRPPSSGQNLTDNPARIR